jgi:hypothetical protein
MTTTPTDCLFQPHREAFMHTLTTTLAAEHLRELRDEAAARRVAALGDEHRSAGLPAWRRSLGAGADRLSLRLAGLAARLDPPSRGAGHAVRRYGAE